MICKYCNSAGCEEDCTDFCLNCDNPIKADEDYCSDKCKESYEGELHEKCGYSSN